MELFSVIPQALGKTSSPTFAGLTITGTGTFRVVEVENVGAGGNPTWYANFPSTQMRTDSNLHTAALLSLSANTAFLGIIGATMTANRVWSFPDITGTVVVTPTTQDIETTGTGTFGDLIVTGNSVFGLNSSVFQPTTDSTTFFQVLDADGGTPVVNIDTTNRRFGIGTNNPLSEFHIVGQSTTDFVQVILTDSDPTYGMSFFSGRSGGVPFGPAIIWSSGQNFRFGGGVNNFVTTDGFTERMRIEDNGNVHIGLTGNLANAADTLLHIAGSDPYLTLHNLTHEDTDGGRESRLNFKGEQSGGEETTLARIEISHDGAADDQKGKVVISTNDGADTDTPTDHITVDAAGNTKIGDAGTTNYLNVDSGGRVLLVGTAQTWEDIRIVPGAFQFPGVADPTLQSWQPGGAGTTYKVYKFSKDDEVHFTCQIPHNYKEGSDIKPHLHWTPGDRGNEEDGNTVGWKIDYSWANFDAAFASSATVDLSDACSGIDDQHEKTDSGTITGTNKAISGILQIRLYRSDTGADDTWVGATAALSPAILEFDLHYEIDSFGSDLELVKDAP